MKILFVTGMSGSGKSMTLRSLEDAGYFCIDNIPPELIIDFCNMYKRTSSELGNVALVVDIRAGKQFDSIGSVLSELDKEGIKYEILFLESSDSVLIKRYKETRRTHPLARENRVTEGILKERELLSGIKARANYILDTSNLSVSNLKEEIRRIVVGGEVFDGIVISIVSFGFKYGIPTDADLVFDVRFLPNPFYLDKLRPLTGLDKPVSDYVLESEGTEVFLKKLFDMMDFLVPNYIKEGKNQLVIAIGCTGGKHRSVTIAELLSNHLDTHSYHITTEHRDILKDR